jgi:hypothetical protein
MKAVINNHILKHIFSFWGHYPLFAFRAIKLIFNNFGYLQLYVF